MSTQQTAKTHYAEVKGTRFAYRHFGKQSTTPLAFLQHFRGTMDDWDPALINPLAAQRSVFLFDNAGVGKSTGHVPTTFAGWAHNLIILIHALHIPQIDLLGFSMGGCAAQMVALNAPHLVRKLILAGTCASMGPNRVTVDVGPLIGLLKAKNSEENQLAIADSFYYRTEAGQAAAKASWDRIHERKEDRSGLVDEEGTRNQSAAFRHFSVPAPTNSYERLHELKMPVLVANGDKDALIDTSNSFDLFRNSTNARLVIYAGAGHGFLNQCAVEFTDLLQDYLDNEVEPFKVVAVDGVRNKDQRRHPRGLL